MMVASGIEFGKYDEALAEILRQLEAVKSGDFTQDELQSAKSELITSLQTVSDAQARLEELQGYLA